MKLKMLYIYFLYPIGTFLYAIQASLTDENLTYVRSLKNPLLFLFWAAATITALAIGFFPCLKASIHQKQLKRAVLASAVLFVLAALCPYAPETIPILSDLHVALSFISLCGMLACIGLMLVSLSWNHTHLQIFWSVYVCICIIAVSILFYYMKVNSLVEIFVAIVSPIFLLELSKKVSQ